jgi:glucose 1-dehydrogenase
MAAGMRFAKGNFVMDTQLHGQRCLITGGNSGIGLGIAKTLAREGVRLIIASRDDYPQALAELGEMGAEVELIQVDLRTEAAVVETVKRAIRRWDGLDLYVNNAAIARHEPVTRVTAPAFHEVMDINLGACVWACREISDLMLPRRAGSILIIGSTVRICPAYGEAVYRISKMGLKMYMETLAVEMAPFGIRVNMITPGYFSTRLTAGMSARRQALQLSEIPLRRPGSPLECGPAAAFLLSNHLSSYITGADLLVDGGLALRPLKMIEDEEILALNQSGLEK